MANAIALESTLTDRYQTTVPTAVRKALGLGKRDRIRYLVQPDGAVVLSRLSKDEQADPVLGRFLAFIVRDMEVHPRRVEAVNSTWLKRMKSLVGKVNIDLDKRLLPDNG
jgi:antitoxin PrlF